MRRHLNRPTQPFEEMPVFQNWDVVAEGWVARDDTVVLFNTASGGKYQA